MDKFSKVVEILYVFQCLRATLHIVLFAASPAKTLIQSDIDRWLHVTGGIKYQGLPKWRGLVWLLWRYPEYRNLYYYRIKKEYRLTSRAFMELSKLLFAPVEVLYVRAGEIDEGLYIQHGYCTDISARRIGKNCWINQLVVIGYSDEDSAPTIGDNVQIKTGAMIFGNITVGDNSMIGAGAVVLKNVPPNCTVVGVPAHIVRRDGRRVNEPL